MAGRRVHFVMPEDLVARIDAACPEGVSRGEFVRRAVEQALGGEQAARPENGSQAPNTEVRQQPPAPAERLQELAREIERNNARARAVSSSLSKRDVRPIPKKGER